MKAPSNYLATVTRLYRRLPLSSWLVLMLCLVVVFRSSTNMKGIYGDGREYILQTQAIALRGALAIDTEKLGPYFNNTNPYGQLVGPARPAAQVLSQSAQAGGGWGGLYPDRNQKYRFCHFWAYPAVVAPVYAIWHMVSPNPATEYLSFGLVNGLFFCLPFLLALRWRPGWGVFLLLCAAVCSPLHVYTAWQHAEVFCFGLAVSSFVLTPSSRGRLLAPALLGLAAAQYAPALAFFPVLLIFQLTWSAPSSFKDWRTLVLSFGMGSMIGLSSVLYFYHYFGVGNLIESVGLASLDAASWKRTLDLLVSPLIGAFWFFPVLFLMPQVFVKRSSWMCWLATILSVGLAAYGSSASTNLISAQAGVTRYAAWFVAPLWGFLLLYRRWPESRRHQCVVLALSVPVVLIMLFMHAPEALDRQVVLHKGRWRPTNFTRHVYEWTGYQDDPETIVEYVLDHELRSKHYFDGVYVWNITPGLSHWIVSQHAAERLVFCMWPGNEVPDFTIIPKENSPFFTGTFPEVGEQVLLGKEGLMTFKAHPVLGPYLFIRVWDSVPAFHANIPAHVRS